MKRNVVVFDLDGTLALIVHRRHFVERPSMKCYDCGGANRKSCVQCDDLDAGWKPRWPAFFAACVDDEPNLPVIATLQAHRNAGHEVMIVSGRSDEVRAETEAWLFKHVFPGEACTFAPLMRKAGDFTPDDELKLQWLQSGAIPRDEVLCAYEDRDRVVAMWRAQGIACFQVAPGAF